MWYNSTIGKERPAWTNLKYIGYLRITVEESGEADVVSTPNIIENFDSKKMAQDFVKMVVESNFSSEDKYIDGEKWKEDWRRKNVN